MTIKSHQIKMSDELWNEFSKMCKSENTDCSKKIRELIHIYTNKTTELPETSRNIIQLVENTYHRSGRIPLDMISRNTNGIIEYEQVVQYCVTKNYPLINSPEEYNICKDPTGW